MGSQSKVRVGIVLPESYYGEEEWRNAETALQYAEEAASKGVKLLLYPEGYPGPATGPLDNPNYPFSCRDKLAEAAQRHDLFIIAGDIIESEIKGANQLSLRMWSPEGKEVACYFRQQPDTPALNAYLYDGKAHLIPGNKPCVVETPFGRVGLQVCSELFVPELVRLQMLEGAEIIVSPVHGLHNKNSFDPDSLRDTWHCIGRSRAAENLMYVLVTQNLYKEQSIEYPEQMMSGAFVAGPENMVARLETPGVLVAELDMERLRFLRQRNYDEKNLSKFEDTNEKLLGCRPGQLYERYPDLYKKLAEPSEYSFNYNYWRDGLDTWKESFKRIYKEDYDRILSESDNTFRFQKT